MNLGHKANWRRSSPEGGDTGGSALSNNEKTKMAGWWEAQSEGQLGAVGTESCVHCKSDGSYCEFPNRGGLWTNQRLKGIPLTAALSIDSQEGALVETGDYCNHPADARIPEEAMQPARGDSILQIF